jgi:multidrug efflux pump subunit AcrA (membrane-fusion protein)
MQGNVATVIPDGGRNTVTIEVESRVLTGGELAMVTVLGASVSHPNIIPISALRMDMNDYFILYVEAEEGRFGTNYYVRQRRVTPGQSDSQNVAVNDYFSRGASFNEPIIINSDSPVYPGMRVRLVD